MPIIIGVPGVGQYLAEGESLGPLTRLRLWFCGFRRFTEDRSGHTLFIALNKCVLLAPITKAQRAKDLAEAQAQAPAQTKRIIEPTAMIPSKRRAN